MEQQVYYCVSLRNGNLLKARLEQDAKIKPQLYQQAWEDLKPMQRMSTNDDKAPESAAALPCIRTRK